MNGIQLFAFVALPLAVAAGGWIIAFAVNPPSRLKNAMTRKPKAHRRQA